MDYIKRFLQYVVCATRAVVFVGMVVCYTAMAIILLWDIWFDTGHGYASEFAWTGFIFMFATVFLSMAKTITEDWDV